jgi:hypothetical protein
VEVERQDERAGRQQQRREAAAEQVVRTQQEASKHPFLARPNPSRLAQAALAERQLLEQTSTEPREQLVAYRHLARSYRYLQGLAQEQ